MDYKKVLKSCEVNKSSYICTPNREEGDKKLKDQEGLKGAYRQRLELKKYGLKKKIKKVLAKRKNISTFALPIGGKGSGIEITEQERQGSEMIGFSGERQEEKAI